LQTTTTGGLRIFADYTQVKAGSPT
jgi:hypothetical protein